MNVVTGRRKRRGMGIVCALSSLAVLSACQSGTITGAISPEVVVLDESPIFSESEYGVPASPRVTNLKRVPKGGGRDQTGKPYQVRGKWYYPKEELGYVAAGKASWYGSNFHGRLTANGEIYDMFHLSAAHPTFPLPSYARVTNRANGKSVLVRVNDRGPYAHGRVVDLSQRAAEVLAFKSAGIADVKVEYVGRAPLEGDDGAMLMASYRPGDQRSIDDGLPSGVMIASNETVPSSTMNALFGRMPLPGVRNPLARPATAVNAPSLVVPAAAAPMIDPSGIPPLPTSRTTAMSYAPAQSLNGGHAALGAMLSVPAHERISIGAVTDPALFVTIASIAAEYGDLREDAGVDGTLSLSIDVTMSTQADDALRALWEAGATDAFVLRD